MHGESDDLGFSVTKDPVHVHDLQATWMHLLGFDHEWLTYRFGRDYRLTCTWSCREGIDCLERFLSYSLLLPDSFSKFVPCIRRTFVKSIGALGLSSSSFLPILSAKTAPTSVR